MLTAADLVRASDKDKAQERHQSDNKDQHSSHKKQGLPFGPDDFKIYERGVMDRSMRGAFRGGRGGAGNQP